MAAVTVAAALLATHSAGVPLRDPDHVGAKRLAMVWCLVVVLVLLDIAVRAARRSHRLWPSLEAMREVRRERWTRNRAIAVTSALVSFFVTYVAYRNLKSVVPLLRPDELYDRQLADFEYGLFGGHNPAELLHALLGTGVATHALSTVYVTFVFFLPLSLALALVFSPDLQGGVFYATALAVNWLLGAASYLMLPARGPIYYAPAWFAELPDTKASYLQGLLLDQRLEFLRDPSAPGAAQNIAAFASLHFSMIFTAAMVALLAGWGRRLQIGLWALLALTTIATIHLGWHYVVDDAAGVVIGLSALALARALTGCEPRTAWRPRLRAARADPAPGSSIGD